MSRFINPAIVSPFEMGIVEKQPPPNIKRGLMLMSKILQNIANHVEFSKEAHMQCFNDFVRSNFEQGRRFFIQVGLVLDKFFDVHIKDVHAHSHTHCTSNLSIKI